MKGQSLIESIGNTPMVELCSINRNPRVRILAKLEGNNPGGSVKDRPARQMILAAETSGELTHDKVILEPTSGNTGIALAMIAAARGYRIKLAMPACVSVERRSVLEAYGAEIELSPGCEATDGAIRLAHRIYEADPATYYMPNQYANPCNVLAHVDDPADFLSGCRELLATDGLVTIEVPYVGELLDRLEYDTVYHEHLSYFSIGSLLRLCDRVGLSIGSGRSGGHSGRRGVALDAKGYERAALDAGPHALHIFGVEDIAAHVHAGEGQPVAGQQGCQVRRVIPIQVMRPDLNAVIPGEGALNHGFGQAGRRVLDQPGPELDTNAHRSSSSVGSTSYVLARGVASLHTRRRGDARARRALQRLGGHVAPRLLRRALRRVALLRAAAASCRGALVVFIVIALAALAVLVPVVAD